MQISQEVRASLHTPKDDFQPTPTDLFCHGWFQLIACAEDTFFQSLPQQQQRHHPTDRATRRLTRRFNGRVRAESRNITRRCSKCANRGGIQQQQYSTDVLLVHNVRKWAKASLLRTSGCVAVICVQRVMFLTKLCTLHCTSSMPLSNNVYCWYLNCKIIQRHTLFCYPMTHTAGVNHHAVRTARRS